MEKRSLLFLAQLSVLSGRACEVLEGEAKTTEAVHSVLD